jgi:hypothetical protein
VLLLVNEGRRRSCLPMRAAGAATCRLDDEWRRCCSLPMRATARSEQGRASDTGGVGVPASGGGQRRAPVCHVMQEPKKGRVFFFYT